LSLIIATLTFANKNSKIVTSWVNLLPHIFQNFAK